MQIKRQDYNKIFDNGIYHYQTGVNLAAQKQFRLATSVIILSLEELMKYLAIMLSEVNKFPFENEISPERGPSIFNDHKLKLKLALEFQEAISTNLAVQFFQNLKKSNGNSAEAKKKFSNRFIEWGLIFCIFPPEWRIPKSKFQEFKHWLLKANQLKQQGFYAYERNGKILSPIEFKKEHYLTTHYFTSIIVKQVSYMKEVDLSNEEFEEWKRTFPSH